MQEVTIKELLDAHKNQLKECILRWKYGQLMICLPSLKASVKVLLRLRVIISSQTVSHGTSNNS